ncbi:MAG: DUF86 domain-containing protein [Lachnospiraceae bacterium]|nr:DUF86 domain-containing protein [Lachnospiraceae bacterium]
MNDRIKIHLARMYEFITDALHICEDENYNYDKILSDKKNQLAITMCLSQIGEFANAIRKVDEETYIKYKFNEPKGMRDRIVHGYGKIDFEIVKETLKTDLPRLKKLIEDNVEKEILDNPYKFYDGIL